MKVLSLGGYKKWVHFSETVSLKQRDYHRYSWKLGELVCSVFLSVGTCFLLGYFFFRSLWAVLPLLPVGVVVFIKLQKEKVQRERREFLTEFRECILAVNILLKAGYSVENAFIECEKDMRMLYGNNSMILQELNLIHRGLMINITLEESLEDLGRRSGMEEIIRFAEAFLIAKRCGGNLTDIIYDTADTIGKRIELKKELDTVLSGKKMELHIMEGMPFLMILYIEMTNRNYFESLYHNREGLLITGSCLVFYLFAVWIGDKILQNMQNAWG